MYFGTPFMQTHRFVFGGGNIENSIVKLAQHFGAGRR